MCRCIQRIFECFGGCSHHYVTASFMVGGCPGRVDFAPLPKIRLRERRERERYVDCNEQRSEPCHRICAIKNHRGGVFLFHFFFSKIGNSIYIM